MRSVLISILFFCFGLHSFGENIIPTPESITINEGVYTINNSSVLVYTDDREMGALSVLSFYVLNNKEFLFVEKSDNADIKLLLSQEVPCEGYSLNITPNGIEIRASDNSGFVYALQTLRQICKSDNLSWNCLSITDRPRLKWRGFMLDSGRQYQSISTIKRYIDMASILKMNIFHWHLTEGLGWRIEIKRYPHLTSKGAFVALGKEQQGYYTQDDIREIVAYAQKRGITIIPEIDMPGHAEAALASYPELGCFNRVADIPKSGFTKEIFCAGKDYTINVLKDILDEVCNLFPSKYIHLGGDEAPKDNWNCCKHCLARVDSLGLKDSHDLQLWFSTEMANHLKKKGKMVIFWGDVVYKSGSSLPDNVIIQWWNYRSMKDTALRNALNMGIPVICSSNYYNYLNFPVTPWRGYDKNRTFDIEDVYCNNPSYKATLEDNPLILGISSALWCDDGVTEDLIDERLFPRIFALAEQMWHIGDLNSFERFYNIVIDKQEWFENEGYRYGPALK